MPVQRQPVLLGRRQRLPHPGVGREKTEIARQHADDRRGDVIDAHRPPDRGRIGIEQLPPQAVGQNHHVAVAVLILLLGVEPAQLRPDSEQAE